jgi:uncharacterized membrane protein YsdA (DUF1294 family)
LLDPIAFHAILLWMGVIGVLGFAAMGIDKALAKSHWGDRVSERTLWLTALAGGFVGIILGALTFHHKTSKGEFWPPVVLAAILWFSFLALVLVGYVHL